MPAHRQGPSVVSRTIGDYLVQYNSKLLPINVMLWVDRVGGDEAMTNHVAYEVLRVALFDRVAASKLSVATR